MAHAKTKDDTNRVRVHMELDPRIYRCLKSVAALEQKKASVLVEEIIRPELQRRISQFSGI